MSPITPEAVGTGIGGAIAGALAILAWWHKRSVAEAKDQEEVAKAGAQRTIADAEHTLYKLLSERLATVEAEQVALRKELATERQWARELEKHIYHLENTMREAGMTPPERVYVMGGRN